MGTVALNESITATAGPDGIARAELGPKVYGHEWAVTRLTTTTNDFANRNELHVYLNGESLGQMVAGSYNANQDFNDDDFTLQTLDRLIIVWSKCTPGTFCTFQLQGVIKDRRG